MENSQEQGPERILTEKEVIEAIKKFAENCSVEFIKSDEKGPYLVEAIVEDEKGEITEYTYQRAGGFREDGKNNGSLITKIDVYYYMDREGYENDEAVGAKQVAEYNSETGEWISVE